MWPFVRRGQSLRRALQVKPGVSRVAMAATTGVWSQRVQIGGWVCALGSGFVLVCFLAVLNDLPADRGSDANNRYQWMHVDLGLLGWIAWWGYVGHVAWWPLALRGGVRGLRSGRHFSRSEQVLLAADVVVVAAISAIAHLTRLKYASFNVFVL